MACELGTSDGIASKSAVTQTSVAASPEDLERALVSLPEANSVLGTRVWGQRRGTRIKRSKHDLGSIAYAA